MPRKSNNANTGRKVSPNQGANRKNRNRNRNRNRGGTGGSPYVQMVADPCNSTLVPGLYGDSEGLLARLKKSLQVKATAGTPGGPTTCGYCLWCPDFSNNTGDGVFPSAGNLFLWQSSSPSASPQDLVTAAEQSAFGSNRFYQANGPHTDTAATLNDPCGSLVETTLVADIRVLAACMQLTFIGKMTDASGEVGFINNLPAQELLTGGPRVPGQLDPDREGTPCTVDHLFTYCNMKRRLGVDTNETIYRLNELSSNHFQDENSRLMKLAPNGNDFSASIPAATAILSPRVFGFVWRNTIGDAGLVFDLTKSIEWRPETSSGLTQTPIRTGGPSLVPYINKVIDDSEEKTGRAVWNRVQSSVGSSVAKVAQAAFTGVASKILDQGSKFLRNHGMQILGAAAPLLLM